MAIAHRSLLLVAALCAGPAVAADPFTPIHQPPPCSAAINRGAQAALDQLAEQLRLDYLATSRSLFFKTRDARGRGEDISGLKLQQRLDRDFFEYQFTKSVRAKAAEIFQFSWKKYNCTPVVFEPIP